MHESIQASIDLFTKAVHREIKQVGPDTDKRLLYTFMESHLKALASIDSRLEALQKAKQGSPGRKPSTKTS